MVERAGLTAACFVVRTGRIALVLDPDLLRN